MAGYGSAAPFRSGQEVRATGSNHCVSPPNANPAAGLSSPSSNRVGYAQTIDDPWTPKAILTMDGGGVRGYGSLIMLRHLMQAIEEIEKSHTEPHESSFHPIIVPLTEDGIDLDDDLLDFADLSSLDSSLDEHEAMLDVPSQPGRPHFDRNRTGSILIDRNEAEDALKPRWEGYYPCHYFDYIGGTSTGGLNAIMISRLRMNVDQCIANYRDMATKIFSSPRSQFKGWPNSKYDHTRLEAEIKKVVSIRTVQEGIGKGDPPKKAWKQFPSPDDLCRTVVVAKQKVDDLSEKPALFRTYDHLGGRNPRLANDNRIWQIARATSAAPTYFDPIEMDGRFYSDGGIRFNNPSFTVYEDARSKEIADGNDFSMDLFLSIGTGGDDGNPQPHLTQSLGEDINNEETKKRKKGRQSIFKHFTRMGAKLEKELTDVTEPDNVMQTIAQSEGFEYYRWTGGSQLAGMELDEWKQSDYNSRGTQADIEDCVSGYMRKEQRQEEVRRIAQFLVDRRRRRCMIRDKWARFSQCVQLRCEFCGNRASWTKFMKHVVEKHSHNITAHPDHSEDYLKNVLMWPPYIKGGPF